MEINELDKRIKKLDKWIHEAGRSLVGFYNSDKGAFHRERLSTEKSQEVVPKAEESQEAIPKTEESKKSIHPTATNRSFFALCEYLRFLYEENQDEQIQDEIKNILKNVSVKYLSLLVTAPDEVRKSSSNEINMFTDSHILISVSMLSSLRKVIELGNVDEIIEAAKVIVDSNHNKLKEWKGGKIKEGDDVHDFVTLHAVRSLDIYSGFTISKEHPYEPKLVERVKNDVLRQLAFNYAGISSKYDPAELVFSTALLNRFATPDAPQIIERAILSLIESQANDGAWPTARFISYEGKGLLHVASYEVALTLTNILIRNIFQGEFSCCESVIKCLDRTFELVKSSYNKIDGFSGWANDHARRKGLLESWTTAIVLTFLIHFRDALQQYRQILILRRYNAKNINEENYLVWPDMIPSLRHFFNIEYDKFKISDPKDDNDLTKAVVEKFLKPIGSSWINRPENASLIMYGPPGTRKTTLAKQIAQVLNWPFIILSPPNFLKRGLDEVEATSAEIFDDLFKLRRAVVLFDECEDFFKKRSSAQQLENRTIGAFITSGMLPRLQELRDTRWVIFLLATNSGPNELDPAVVRPGRFDFAEEIGYPTLKAQKQYVENNLKENPENIKVLHKVLDQYAEQHQADKDSSVSFAHLDKLMDDARNSKLIVEKTGLRLHKLVQQKGPTTLSKAETQ